jgi:hypothetical protein
VLRQLPYQRHEIVSAVAAGSGEGDQFLGFRDDRSSLGSPRHHNRASSAHLEKAFAPEHSKGAQHSVGVHAENRGEVLGLGDPIAWSGLAFGNGTPNLCRDLLVEKGLILTIDGAQTERVGSGA